MIEKPRVIVVKRTLHNSQFYNINAKIFSDTLAKIGASAGATKSMVMRTAEMVSIMPDVLGLDPKSIHSNWDKAIKNYFDSISVHVPDEGLKLQTGFAYDFDDVNRKEYIAKLAKEQTSVKDTASLATYVESKVAEDEKYKYGTPIDKAEYILYRHCLLLGDIANTPEDVLKAPGKIRLYMVNESQLALENKQKRDLRSKVMKAYTDVISDEDMTEDMVYALGEFIQGDISRLQEHEVHAELERVMNSLPNQFLATFEDKNIKIKAKINKFIRFGLLKRIEGTETITDATNPADNIGNNLDAAVNFFANAENKDKVAKYEIMYKSLNK